MDWPRLLLEASPDALLVWAADGRIVDCNARAAEWLGRPREELLALTARDVEVDLSPAVWLLIGEVTRTGATLVRHTHHRRRQGDVLPVACHLREVAFEQERLLVVSARPLGPPGPPPPPPARVATAGDDAAFVLVDDRGLVAATNLAADALLGAAARAAPLADRLSPPLAQLLEQARRQARARAPLSASGPERGTVRGPGGEEIEVDVWLSPIEATGEPAVALVLARPGPAAAAAEPRPHALARIVGRSEVMARLRAELEIVAATDATVLILGETGAGKELVADALHELGPRRDAPLVKVNCAAIPGSLVESELFGHARGAFTGAELPRPGKIEAADGGSLFLDEIGDLPLELQAKLLRVLQERRVERVGTQEAVAVDFRLFSATHRDLAEAVAAGRFRADLYYRLSVVPLRVPPLRARREDIPDLVRHFVRRACARHGRFVERIPPEVLDRLAACDWPGNVRELANVVTRAVILGRGESLELEESWLSPASADRGEAERIRAALAAHGWRVAGAHGAAQALGLKPTTLEARMKRLGIERPGRG